jgi:hypothetical protein
MATRSKKATATTANRPTTTTAMKITYCMHCRRDLWKGESEEEHMAFAHPYNTKLFYDEEAYKRTRKSMKTYENSSSSVVDMIDKTGKTSTTKTISKYVLTN